MAELKCSCGSDKPENSTHCPKCDEPNVEVRKAAITSKPFDTEQYNQLFCGFSKDPTVLNISSEKSVSEMSNEELTAWIYKLDDFCRDAKVAKQVARITIEDRKLQMTEEQKKKQYELDKKYKPATPTRAKATKTPAKKGTKAKLTEEEKRIKACIDMELKLPDGTLITTDAQAIEWLKSKGRL